MDDRGDEVLAGAGLAFEEDRGHPPAAGHPADDLADLRAQVHHTGGSPEEFVQRVHGGDYGGGVVSAPVVVFSHFHH